MEVSLSSSDIQKWLPKAKILTYDQLANYDSLDKLLGRHGAVIILYQWTEGYGHWCALFKRKKNYVEFFDSYGGFPDSQLDHVPNYYRKHLGEDRPHLTYLLYDAPHKTKIEYNDHRLQKLKKGINTCGRHVISRILHKTLSIDQYADNLRSLQRNTGISPDEYVVALTEQ